MTEYWLAGDPSPDADVVGLHRIVIDEALPEDRPLMLLEPVGHCGVLSLTSAMARRLRLSGLLTIDAESLVRVLEAGGVRLNGADYLFYLPASERLTVASERALTTTRRLVENDGAAFADFTTRVPDGDLDEAFVELDHWLVFGTFDAGRLVSVASMYPWRNSQLADLGVITLPECRGRGLARATISAISARALDIGYEPQYRCQLDNVPSTALARSAGFACFGTWDVVDLNDT